MFGSCKLFNYDAVNYESTSYKLRIDLYVRKKFLLVIKPHFVVVLL